MGISTTIAKRPVAVLCSSIRHPRMIGHQQAAPTTHKRFNYRAVRQRHESTTTTTTTTSTKIPLQQKTGEWWGKGSKTSPISFVVGTAAGALGSLAGMGGGFVMIPLMTSSRILGLTQHQAHGTSLFAVMCTGLAGAISYGDQVQLESAAAIAACGMLSARMGAQMTNYISGRALKQALGVLMLAVAPIVPAKALILEHYNGASISNKIETTDDDDDNDTAATTEDSSKTTTNKTFSRARSSTRRHWIVFWVSGWRVWRWRWRYSGASYRLGERLQPLSSSRNVPRRHVLTGSSWNVYALYSRQCGVASRSWTCTGSLYRSLSGRQGWSTDR
jgi:hypothetical protein